MHADGDHPIVPMIWPRPVFCRANFRSTSDLDLTEQKSGRGHGAGALE